MFGYIRFILAYFVLLSHVGIGLAGKNIGVFAVVIFYILAGLVTSKVFIKIAPQNAQISYFIKDRFLRVYPAFFFAFALTVLFFCATSYLQPHFNAKNLLLNALIAPLNYFFWLDVSVIDAPVGLNFIIPPAWSLGAELQAYALLVLAIKFRRLGHALATGSLGVYAAANLGFTNADIYGYRLVCGVFFMFYTGFLIYQKEFGKLAVFYAAVAVLAGYLFYSREFSAFGVETATGYLVGAAVVLAHERFKFKLKFNDIAGSLSYAIFISHFLFIWLSEFWLGGVNLVFVTVGSVAFGLINFYLIERKINKIRFRKRV